MPFRLALFLMLLFSCGRLAAADSGTDRSVVIERHHQHFTVDADGAYTLDVELVKTIATPSAVAQHAEQFISFNGSLDKVKSVEAWTTKPDGRRVKLEPQQIRDQHEAASLEAPMFQDTRLKVLIFPGVQAGDTLSKIAKAHLGDANAYMKIFNANKDQLSDPDKIKPGQVLKIPSA